LLKRSRDRASRWTWRGPVPPASANSNGCALALIRPDGIVAWRGENATDDPAALVDQVTRRTDRTLLLAQTADGIARRRRARPAAPRLSRTLEGTDPRRGAWPELESSPVRKRIAWQAASVQPPVRRPGKIIVIGLNYRDHAAEIVSALPARPAST